MRHSQRNAVSYFVHSAGASRRVISNVISKISRISVTGAKDVKQVHDTKVVDTVRITSEKDSTRTVDRTLSKTANTKTTSSSDSIDSATKKLRKIVKSIDTKRGELISQSVSQLVS